MATRRPGEKYLWQLITFTDCQRALHSTLCLCECVYHDTTKLLSLQLLVLQWYTMQPVKVIFPWDLTQALLSTEGKIGNEVIGPE